MIDKPLLYFNISRKPIEFDSLITSKLNKLMNIIGYSFSNPEYLLLALSHESFISILSDLNDDCR